MKKIVFVLCLCCMLFLCACGATDTSSNIQNEYPSNNYTLDSASEVIVEEIPVSEDTAYPKLNFSSATLTKDLESIQRRYGESTVRPFENIDGINSFVERHGFKNLNNAELYHIYVYTENYTAYTGVDQDGVVFWMTDLGNVLPVKDFLTDEELAVEPSEFTYKSKGIQVWQIEDGYFVLTTLQQSSENWYNRIAEYATYVRDLDYLSYID